MRAEDFAHDEPEVYICRRCGKEAHLFRWSVGGVGDFCSHRCASLYQQEPKPDGECLTADGEGRR